MVLVKVECWQALLPLCVCVCVCVCVFVCVCLRRQQMHVGLPMVEVREALQN